MNANAIETADFAEANPPSKRYSIVGLGEVLWDVFPSGARFGGAPANFACSTSLIGRDKVKSYVVSGVGNDDLGRHALAELSERGVDVSFVDRVSQPTGQVNVKINEEGDASYEFAADSAWDFLAWSEPRQQLANRCDAVCFGSLGQRSPKSRETIQRFLTETSKNCLRVFDINLRPPFYSAELITESLRLGNVLKLNEDELVVLRPMLGLTGSTNEQLQQLESEFGLHAIALTRGSEGSILFRAGEISELPGESIKVVDTVGAGDAFTATFVLGLLQTHNLQAINQHASRVATYVCGQIGATPAIPLELLTT